MSHLAACADTCQSDDLQFVLRNRLKVLRLKTLKPLGSLHYRILPAETWTFSQTMAHWHELDLLIACALPPAHTQIGARVRSSFGGPVGSSRIDWNKLRTLAAYHRVQPLLYQRLAEHASAMAPANVMT